jgi:hypothetical protein
VVRRRLILWGAAAAVALVAAAAIYVLVRDERGDASGRPVGADGFAAQLSVSPRNQLFGQQLVARMDLLVDREVLDPDRVSLSTEFDPFTPAGETRRSRSDYDRFTRLRWDFPLECLVPNCVPETLTKEFDLGSTVVRHRGQPIGIVEWPSVTIASRVGDFEQAQQAGRGPQQQQNVDLLWRATLRLRQATYTVDPTVLTAGLTGFALLLLVSSLYFLQVAFPSAPLGFRRLRRVKLTPLERALAVLERAHERGIEREQRLALDELARELRTGGRSDLASDARQLAWEESVPDADRTATLSDHVRDVIAGRSNGNA